MKLTVLIPASFTTEVDDDRIEAYKIGQIARALSVFRCNELVVYDDVPDEGDKIALVLEYAATPPYLRKDVYDRRPELKEVGVLPPLRTPSHRVEPATGDKGKETPEYRMGVVTKVESDGRVWVNCGTQHPVALRVSNPEGEGIREGERVTLRISSRDPVRAKTVSRDEVPHYWGYSVDRKPLDEWIDDYEGTVVSTSRYGERFGCDAAYTDADELALVFGSPDRGVEAILRDYYGTSIGFDAVVNTVPEQGTETVRTEEAVFATLSLLNVSKI
ncbi:MAG: putative RNA uridine N3 methyltransferase [Halobacteria archaeon]